jgi:hypothetical protein
VVDPIWVAVFGTLISATTMILVLNFRQGDRQSRTGAQEGVQRPWWRRWFGG